MMSTLATSTQPCSEVPTKALRQEKKKRHPGCKGRSKTISIFRWHDLVNRKSKESTHKKLELINKFSKDEGYEMNIQKSIVSLCTLQGTLQKCN